MRRSYLIAFSVILIIVIYILGSKISNRLLLRYEEPDQVKNFEKLEEVLKYVASYYVDDIDWDKATQSAIDAILSDLDPHSVYISAQDAALNEENFQGMYQGIGIQFDIIENYITVITPIPDSPSDRVGLMAGDRIIKIDGESAIGMSQSDVPKKLKGPKGTEVDITVLRDGVNEPLEFTIIRDDIPIFTVNAYHMNQDSTGYIFLSRFAKTTEEEFEGALSDLEQQGMKRLVLDLRGNAGGYLDQAVKVAARFISGHNKIVYTKGKLSHFNEYYYADSFGSKKIREIPLIILINHASASASEIVAGAIQDYDRGLIVGTTSFGKGLVQREFQLNDDSRLRLTISKYYTPSGRLIQRPYKGKKIEQYYGFDSLAVDTVRNDSLEQGSVYYTASGRRVFGGGGIRPDSTIDFISNVKTPKLIQRMLQKRIFFELASKYANRHKSLGDSFETFSRDFEVSDALVNDLFALAQEKNITSTTPDMIANRAYMKNKLKAEIARSLWGNDKYYIVLLENDNQFQQALKLFPDAERIRQRFRKNMALNDR